MDRVLNTFMLRGRSPEAVCRIAAAAGCTALSVDLELLESPALEGLLEKWGLSVSCVGAVFLRADRPEESLKRAETVLRRAAQFRSPAVSVVLQGEDPSPETMAAFCRQLARLGKNHGIRVCLEPLDPEMSHVSILTDLNLLTELCRGADPQWFGWIMDLCHCRGRSPDPELMPYLHAVHLADLGDGDQDHRLFPGEGKLPLFEIFDCLHELGFRGPVECEVISPAVPSMPEEALITKLARSFRCTSRNFALGELAVHRFAAPDPSGGELTMVGGSAGMVVSQLEALGVQPLLGGFCGKDTPGLWLKRSTAAYAFDVLCQPGRRTSVVDIEPLRPDGLAIQAGNVLPRQAEELVDALPDIDAFVYLPFFPGYEGLEQAARRKSRWKMILDFGFYQWCGNPGLLRQQLQKAAPGFCALVNAKNMSQPEKERLGNDFISHGFRYAILTDGAAPLLLFEGETFRRFDISPAPVAADTCGAGDCLTAGIMAKLSSGETMENAVAFGITVAYHKIQSLGIWRAFDHG